MNKLWQKIFNQLWNLQHLDIIVAYKAYMMCTNVCIVHYILIRLLYLDSSRAETVSK